MANYLTYVKENGALTYNRAYRETFIFQMINHFEDNYVPDSAEGVDGYTYTRQTIAQKRRLRNQIYNEMVKSVEAYNATHDDEKSLYDTDVIVDAFFNTSYGKGYLSKRSDWEAGSPVREEYVNRITEWTNGQDVNVKDVRRVTISPYDPMFSNCDLFNDNVDEIGYIISAMNEDGTPVISAKGNPRYGDVLMTPNADIHHVYVGRNHSVADYDTKMDIAKSEPKALEGRLSSVGYHNISHYIKGKKNKNNVKNYLLGLYPDLTQPSPVSDDAREFMSDVCKYLSDNGFDFSVEISGDNHLVAKLEGSRTHIRLLDIEEPQYQGRVYDEGRVAYISSPRIKNITDTGNVDIITNNHRMNLVKWYFGSEPIDIESDSSLLRTGRYKVGETGTVPGLNDLNRTVKGVVVSKSPVAITKRANHKTQSDDNSVLLAVTKYKNERGVEVPAMLNIQLAASSYTRQKDSPDMVFAMNLAVRNDDFINRPELVISRIPDDKALPGDIVVNENGERVWASEERAVANIDYYKHVIVREKLNEWVESAKSSYSEGVDIDDLFAQAEQYRVDSEFAPLFSSDDDMAEIQNLYWKVLTQNSDITVGDTVINKDMSFEDRKAFVANHFHAYLDETFGVTPDIPHPLLSVDNTGKGFNPEKVATYVSTGDSQGIQKNYDYIRHMLSQLGDDYNMDYIIGDTYIGDEIKKDLIKFDDSKVVATLRLAEYYTPGTKQPKANFWDRADYDRLNDMPVSKEMLIHTAETLARSGCDPLTVSVQLDENGIIKYRALQVTDKHPSANIDYANYMNNETPGYAVLTGEIGQIFEPDDLGVIHTKYAVPDKKVLIPGYDAYLVHQDPDNPQPMRERLRLSNWEHQMKQAITKELHRAAFSQAREYKFTPKTTSLNTVYRHTYDTAMLEEDYLANLPVDPNNPTPEEVTFMNVIKTLKGRCRFPNEYGDDSTTMAQSMLEHPTREEARSYDYYYSDLNDNQNLRVLGEFYDGIFDADLTGTAKTQGLVRYLVEGVEIDDVTGKVKPVEYDVDGELPKCPLMNDVLFDKKDFNTWDRREMAGSQVLTALHTPRHVGVAMMNFEGWNVEDGFIVSKRFAEQNAIKGAQLDEQGNRIVRPLMVQDKLSDMNGNKGVIAIVVDPDLSSDKIADQLVIDASVADSSIDIDDANLKATSVLFNGVTYDVTFDSRSKDSHRLQAAYQIQKELGVDGLDNLMHTFAENEELDVIMSPYSGMSRFNGGSIESLMETPNDLVIKGETIEGGMGYMDLIVVDMLADVKTHFYDEDAIKEGKGRKASGQLAWGLQSKGTSAILNEFFGDNDGAIADFREYAIALGLDVSTDGTMLVGYHPQEERFEYRNLIKLPETTDDLLSITKSNTTVKFNPDVVNGMTNDLLETLNENGGFMELPFQLDFNTKSYINSQSNLIPDEVFLLQKTGQTYTTSDGKVHETFGMPVLPQGLRSGQDYLDGTSRAHDYTNRYVDIYKHALMYKACQEKLLDPKVDAKSRAALEEMMKSSVSSAQAAFDKVTSDIADNRFNTKHNVFRDVLMANRVDRSATAVWSADPRLDIDTIAMSSEHAMQLGLMDENGDWIDKYEGGKVLVWRDPVLHDSNIRYMKVNINENLTGVAIHPLMAQCFDGDFDGDSVAVVSLNNKDSKTQAYTAFSFETNMLNKGVKTMVTDPDTKESVECYPLYINDGLDCRSNAYTNPELMDRLARLTIKVNDIEAKALGIANGTIDPSTVTVESNVRKKDENGKYVYKETSHGRKPVYEKKLIEGKSAINVLRKQAFAEMNQWAHDALDGIGTDHIIVKDEKTVMASLQHVVDTGAKGSQSKLKSLADNLGIEYELGDDGRVDLNTVHRLQKDGKNCSKGIYEGNQREIDKQIQETAAYKADNTALGGTTAQQGVAAFRDVNLTSALELTYPITQAILQSKHDPKDAKVKDEIVRFWGKDIWNGYKLTGDWTLDDPTAIQNQAHERITEYVKDPNGNFIQRTAKIPEVTVDGNPVIDENGKPKYRYEPMVDESGNPVYEKTYVKCTREEWIAQMKGMMTALKVDVNHEYTERIADIMTRKSPAVAVSIYDDNPIIYTNPKNYKDSAPVRPTSTVGTVYGLTDFAREHGSLLDKAAYADKMTALVQAALVSCPEYVDKLKESKMAYKLNEKICTSIAVGVDDAMDEYKALKAERDALLTSTDKADKTAAKSKTTEMKRIKNEICNSSSFISDTFKHELVGDKVREETGSSKNVRVKVKNGEAVEVYSAPKPIGRKDSFIDEKRLNEGCTYMGESQVEYEARLASLEAAAVEEPIMEASDTSVTAEISTNDVTTSTSVSKVTKSSPDEKVTKAVNELGIENIKPQNNGSNKNGKGDDDKGDGNNGFGS